MWALPLTIVLAAVQPLPAAEAAFAAFRDADDMQRLTPSPRHERTRQERAAAALDLLRPIDRATLTAIDRRAYDAMRRALEPKDDATDDAARALYAAYARAGAALTFEGQAVDRVSLLGRLALEPDASRRRSLFVALAPVWASMAGKPAPYLSLVASRRSAWAAAGGPTPFAAKAAEWAMSETALEQLLVDVLSTWRDHLAPQAPVEPWDWYFVNGAAGRALASDLTRAEVIETATRYFRELGADPKALGVTLDLTPHEGKDPVDFTDFVRHGREVSGRWRSGRFLVSAELREGGLGDLYELMHELGHAAHIAAIRGRPAFNDWPDSDVLTEALADMLGVEAYDAVFQRRALGTAADPAANRRAQLADLMLDIAWALFEIRVHRTASPSPDAIWTELTEQYLRIRPHPELSWWAMRGQLIDSPGYMTNYALGGVLTEALRARVRALRGDAALATPTPALYHWLSERIYRYGLERPSLDLVQEFLGGPLEASALEAAIASVPSP
jgi:hypothetical protein